MLANTTSIGMHPDVSTSPVSATALQPFKLVFDAVYTPMETQLLKVSCQACKLYSLQSVFTQLLLQPKPAQRCRNCSSSVCHCQWLILLAGQCIGCCLALKASDASILHIANTPVSRCMCAGHHAQNGQLMSCRGIGATLQSEAIATEGVKFLPQAPDKFNG